MVSYGAWRQDPNFVIHDAGSRNGPTPTIQLDNERGGESAEVRQQPESFHHLTQAELTLAVSRAIQGAGHSGKPALAFPGVSNEFNYRIENTVRVTEWGAKVFSPQWHINPYPGGFAYWPLEHVTADPDAIGIEFEGTTFDPSNPFPSAPGVEVGLALAADTQLSAWVQDTTVPSGDIGNGWTTNLHVTSTDFHEILDARGNGTVVNSNETFHREDYGYDVDLSILADKGWQGTIYADTTDVILPVGLPDDVSTPGFLQSGVVSYGWIIDPPALLWTLRPPLYRWVYDTKPYRRTFPSDAATEGARRTFPPSAAIQSSNRTSGGYL